MTNSRRLLIMLAGLAAAGAVGAEAPGAAPDGRAIFERRCAACHAPGLDHPGTMQLTVGRGLTVGALEARPDLTPAFVTAIVRSGLGLMPAFRPSEIDDAALDALARYLSPADPAAVETP